MNKSVYIINSIPYVNAVPHVGHALEAVQGDALTRFYRLLKYDVFFSMGSDENAIKNVEAAEKKGIPVNELVNENSAKFVELNKALNISNDKFIKTSSNEHKEGARKFWKLCEKDIYKKNYKGLYCVGCEAFYKEAELEDDICPIHNRKLEIAEEENYFFSLSKYQKKLEELISSDTTKIYPEFRKSEILSFIKKGLEDFSVSRPATRTKGWGVPVPGDETQTIYVWFDALINYLTILNFPDGELFKKFWIGNPNRYHVIGKDIIKFHALYWSAMLLSAKLPTPQKLYVHGFITVEGKKMSKSIGNVIDPFELINKYGTDAVRYYFLREIPSLDDGDFSYHRMQQIYENDLANELGNSVLRITTLAEKDNLTVEKNQEYPINKFLPLIEAFQFNNLLELIWKDVKQLNKNIDDFAPWKKTAEERRDFLISALQTLYSIGWQLQPFLPETAEKIISSTTGKIQKPTPLFRKK